MLKRTTFAMVLSLMLATSPALAGPVTCGDKATVGWVNQAIGGYFNGGIVGKLKVTSVKGTVSTSAAKLVCKVRVRHTFLNEDVEFLDAHLILNLKPDGSVRDADLLFLEGSKRR